MTGLKLLRKSLITKWLVLKLKIKKFCCQEEKQTEVNSDLNSEHEEELERNMKF